MSWRIADSLKKLREQVNAAYPSRDKASDGAIGDDRHATTDSDHNPWVRDARGQGVVTAIDIDEDLTPDVNTVMPMIESIIASRDPRVKYIIYEGRMCSSYPANGYKAWTWRPYSGKNAHKHHVHISVNPSPYHYDNRAEWNIGSRPQAVTEPVLLEIPPVKEHTPEEQRIPREAATQMPVEKPAETQAPAPQTVTVNAPPAEGSTATAAKVTVLGFVVPTFLASAVKAAQSAMTDGYISAQQISEVAINFLSANTKYVFAGAGLIIGGMMLKKLYKQITLWLQMYFAARKDMNNVTVKPQ